MNTFGRRFCYRDKLHLRNVVPFSLSCFTLNLQWPAQMLWNWESPKGPFRRTGICHVLPRLVCPELLKLILALRFKQQHLPNVVRSPKPRYNNGLLIAAHEWFHHLFLWYITTCMKAHSNQNNSRTNTCPYYGCYKHPVNEMCCCICYPTHRFYILSHTLSIYRLIFSLVAPSAFVRPPCGAKPPGLRLFCLREKEYSQTTFPLLSPF